MPTHPPQRRPRGRPRSTGDDYPDTRQRLLRCGLERLTEGGFAALTVDDVLKRTGLPKGSFYHQFESKEAFAAAALEAYADYFAAKLGRHFGNAGRPPLDRIRDFIDDAATSLARHAFRRGCLVGNLGQEASTLDDSLRLRLEAILCDWEGQLANCLADAVAAGQLPSGVDCRAFAHLFWIGWEGAILRMRLTRSPAPLQAFGNFFIASLTAPAIV
ncbi:MAG: TetR/AcrR family transcriptional regulator [Rhodocyclales bacterium]|nr:TetR/AcrR family transcriptional regulator [Rhodocyclales bacterium]